MTKLNNPTRSLSGQVNIFSTKIARKKTENSQAYIISRAYIISLKLDNVKRALLEFLRKQTTHPPPVRYVVSKQHLDSQDTHHPA